MIKTVINRFKIRNCRKKWRKHNQHNHTRVGRRMFNPKIASVGSFSYGELNIYSYNEESNDKIEIGNYVSIAEDVKLFLSVNHQLSTITTYPLRSKLIAPHPLDAVNNGKLVIEDEVWIGANSIIFSGLTIGKGAIVATGSIVNSSIEPYSIVGGNPAKLIRYRFNKEMRNRLMEFNLSDYDKSHIINNIDLFYKEIENIEDLEALILKIKTS